MAGEGFHVLADHILDLVLEGDDVAGLQRDAWLVRLLAVDEDMAVHDRLPGRPDRSDESTSSQDVVEALFKELQQQLAGVAFASACFGDVASELLFKEVVVVSILSVGPVLKYGTLREVWFRT